MENGKVIEGFQYFTPTPEFPTFEGYLRHQAKEKGRTIASFDAVIKQRNTRQGLKWSGVFNPPQHLRD